MHPGPELLRALRLNGRELLILLKRFLLWPLFCREFDGRRRSVIDIDSVQVEVSNSLFGERKESCDACEENSIPVACPGPLSCGLWLQWRYHDDDRRFPLDNRRCRNADGSHAPHSRPAGRYLHVDHSPAGDAGSGGNCADLGLALWSTRYYYGHDL